MDEEAKGEPDMKQESKSSESGEVEEKVIIPLKMMGKEQLSHPGMSYLPSPDNSSLIAVNIG